MMLAGLRGIARRPLRSGSQTLHSHAVCGTPSRFCYIAHELKSRYATRKPDAKDTNRRSEQFDLDLSALRASKNPEQKRGNSSRPRFRCDQHLDGNAQDSAHRRDDDKPQNSARERHKAKLEWQYAFRQDLECTAELKAFGARCLGRTDRTVTLPMAREMMILLGTLRRLDLVQLKKFSTFAVAVIFAPAGAEDVTILHRLLLGLALTLWTVVCMCSQVMFGIALFFVKRHVKFLEWEQEKKR